MDVATPWFRIIWVFVALGECLGVVPSDRGPYLPMADSDRGAHATVVVELPKAAAMPVVVPAAADITLGAAAGYVTITVTAADGGVQEIEIPPVDFPGCADAPCPACPDGTTKVPDLPMILSNLVTLKARPDLAEVEAITITAHKDTLYREITALLETSRAIRILETGPTPCDVLAAKTGAALFPNVVFAVQE